MDINLKKHWFIQTKSEKIEDFYDFDNSVLLGSGGYAKVYRANLKNTQISRAIKSISKAQVTNSKRLTTEINAMKNLDHPNVIKLFEVFEDQRNIYLVMELCEGGELFDRIADEGTFSEQNAKILFRQIMLALNYCHANGIAHRDLKPENLIFLTKDPSSPIKVIDFGVSCIFHDDPIKKSLEKKLMTTQTGTVRVSPHHCLALLHVARDPRRQVRRVLRHLGHGRDPLHPHDRHPSLQRRERPRDPRGSQARRVHLRQ